MTVPNSPYSLCGCKATLKWKAQELGSCVKVEVVVLGSPSLTVLMVLVCGSMDEIYFWGSRKLSADGAVFAARRARVEGFDRISV